MPCQLQHMIEMFPAELVVQIACSEVAFGHHQMSQKKYIFIVVRTALLHKVRGITFHDNSSLDWMIICGHKRGHEIEIFLTPNACFSFCWQTYPEFYWKQKSSHFPHSQGPNRHEGQAHNAGMHFLLWYESPGNKKRCIWVDLTFIWNVSPQCCSQMWVPSCPWLGQVCVGARWKQLCPPV